MKFAHRYQPPVYAVVMLLSLALRLDAQSSGTQEAVADYLNQAQAQAQIQAQAQRGGASDRTAWNGPTIGGGRVPKTFANPILPGHHPDPSICRVDRTYYLVAGSGCWYPGLPVYRSQDLVNWKALGHVLVRPSQRFIHDRADVWLGSASPTIRHHEGLFYVIATARIGRHFTANFLVTASNPAGPWSDPLWLDGPGESPSLLFDPLGPAWVVTRDTESPGSPIFIRELDLMSQALVGPATTLVLSGGRGGQHLYRMGDHYLLLAASAGERNLRSYRARMPRGPYVACDANSSHAQLPVVEPAAESAFGDARRADIVQMNNGDWWSVYAAVRQTDAVLGLGSETFLVPLHLEGGCPVLDLSASAELLYLNRPRLGWYRAEKLRARDDFARGRLHPRWNQYRTPVSAEWSCQERTGWLRLKLGPAVPTEPAHSTLVARRVDRPLFYAATRMDFRPRTPQESAGLIVMEDFDAQIRLSVEQGEEGQQVTLRQVKQGVETSVGQIPFAERYVQLALECRGETLQFWAGAGDNLQPVGGPINSSLGDASRPQPGTYVGVFATSSGQPSHAVADFDWFDYRPQP